MNKIKNVNVKDEIKIKTVILKNSIIMPKSKILHIYVNGGIDENGNKYLCIENQDKSKFGELTKLYAKDLKNLFWR